MFCTCLQQKNRLRGFAINLHLIPHGSVYKCLGSTTSILMKTLRGNLSIQSRGHSFYLKIRLVFEEWNQRHSNFGPLCAQIFMQAASSSPRGSRLRFRSLKEPRNSRRVVVCSVRLQPGLELMCAMLMFSWEAPCLLRIKCKLLLKSCRTTNSKSTKWDAICVVIMETSPRHFATIEIWLQ